MARKKFIRKREILPDPKFGDVVVAKFINSLMEAPSEPPYMAGSRSYGAPPSNPPPPYEPPRRD